MITFSRLAKLQDLLLLILMFKKKKNRLSPTLLRVIVTNCILLPTLLSCARLTVATDTPTSLEVREDSWKRHSQMREDSPFRELEWEAIGPRMQGGRIESIAVPDGEPNTMYLGVGSGGIWKTVNNSLTWEPVFEQQSSGAIGAVAVSKSEPETVWVGTGEVLLARSGLPGFGVFKSTDAGKSWQNMGLKDTQHVARVLIHPADASTVLVAAIGHQSSANEQRGVFKTTDGGKTWRKTLFVDGDTAAIDLVMDPADPNILYASMWDRSKEHGQAKGTGSGVYKSMDLGETWQQLAGGLPQGKNVGRIAIDVAPTDSSVLYALADEGEKDWFYRSDDSGASWKKTYGELKARWDWCEIKVSPDNANEVYSIGQNSFVTKDGGESFSKIEGTVIHLLPHGAEVIHLDTHAIWINPENGDHLVFGTDGGNFVTYDRCKTWLHVNNLPIAECYAVTYDMDEPYNIYIGTQDNAALFGPNTHRPRDGKPDEWQHVYLDPWGGGDSYFTYRDPADPNSIYYEHQLGVMRRKDMSTGKIVDIQPRLDGEQLRFAWMTPFFPSKYNKRTLYAAANRVFKSADRGDSWSAISDELVSKDQVSNLRYRAITTLAESPVKQGLLFAGTDNADLWVTEDDGGSWTSIGEQLPKRNITRVCASSHDQNRVFVSLSGAGIDDYAPYLFRSDDVGQTWKSIGEGLPHEPINVVYEDPDVPNLLYVGTDMGVYVSLDGGKRWSSLCSNLPTTSVYDLFVHPREKELVIGTHGRSCFLLDAKPIQAKSAQGK